MKIAIIGASGFLGTKLFNILSKNHEIVGTYSSREKEGLELLDATDAKSVEAFIRKHTPELVIDTIALTSSFVCEKDPELCEKLNYLTAKNILRACEKVRCILVFMSSSYLFEGERGNYSEADPVVPQNEYARTKIMAEKEILHYKNAIILRVDVMYGYNGKDERNGVFNQILLGKPINLRDPNQKRLPLLVDDVAQVILKLVEKNQRGIFHVAGPTRIRIIDFLKTLESVIRNESLVGISEGESQIKIKIPKNATLNTSKIEKLGIKTHSLEEGIKIMKEQVRS